MHGRGAGAATAIRVEIADELIHNIELREHAAGALVHNVEGTLDEFIERLLTTSDFGNHLTLLAYATRHRVMIEVYDIDHPDRQPIVIQPLNRALVQVAPLRLLFRAEHHYWALAPRNNQNARDPIQKLLESGKDKGKRRPKNPKPAQQPILFHADAAIKGRKKATKEVVNAVAPPPPRPASAAPGASRVDVSAAPAGFTTPTREAEEHDPRLPQGSVAPAVAAHHVPAPNAATAPTATTATARAIDPEPVATGASAALAASTVAVRRELELQAIDNQLAAQYGTTMAAQVSDAVDGAAAQGEDDKRGTENPTVTVASAEREAMLVKCATCGKVLAPHRPLVTCATCHRVWHGSCANPQQSSAQRHGAREYTCVDCHGEKKKARNDVDDNGEEDDGRESKRPRRANRRFQFIDDDDNCTAYVGPHIVRN